MKHVSALHDLVECFQWGLLSIMRSLLVGLRKLTFLLDSKEVLRRSAGLFVLDHSAETSSMLGIES